MNKSVFFPDNGGGGDGDISTFSPEAEEHNSGPSFLFALTGFLNRSPIFVCIGLFFPGVFNIIAHVLHATVLQRDDVCFSVRLTSNKCPFILSLYSDSKFVHG